MKKNKQRLPAFTILELTVAMLISAIVVAIAYTAFSMISNAHTDFTKRNDGMATIVRLDELLQRDFQVAEGIYMVQDSIVFTTGEQSVRYQFAPEQVIRNSSIADTFKVQTESLQLYFEHQPLTRQDMIMDNEQGRLDELQLTVLYKNEKFPYHYLKLYSSENLIKRNPNAIH